jgi:ribosome-interacting GTPase 1
MKLSGSTFCIFSGDVFRNNEIDLDDVLEVYNEAAIFSSGVRLRADVTGDNIVDLSDITIVFNNSNNFVSVISPMTILK